LNAPQLSGRTLSGKEPVPIAEADQNRCSSMRGFSIKRSWYDDTDHGGDPGGQGRKLREYKIREGPYDERTSEEEKKAYPRGKSYGIKCSAVKSSLRREERVGFGA